MIAALSGRRIDKPGAGVQRFPLANVSRVLQRVTDHLRERGVTVLVSSAACGADLLGVQAARALGIRTRIVLPIERHRFRAMSVVDRPGGWGDVFDSVAAEASRRGDLVVCDSSAAGKPDYDAAILRILSEGEQLSRHEAPMSIGKLALVVWDNDARGPTDYTAQFRARALAVGWKVVEIATND